jgi:hypothetical protein
MYRYIVIYLEQQQPMCISPGMNSDLEGETQNKNHGRQYDPNGNVHMSEKV